MLDYKVAMKNFGWNGYQPPQTRVHPDNLVAQGYIPDTMKTTILDQSAFDRGYELLELSPPVDNKWHGVWQQFKAGA
jgi:spermidine/putrescine transport system substrate-binding protein